VTIYPASVQTANTSTEHPWPSKTVAV